MSIPQTKNIERKCFQCGERVYLNPDVRKKDIPTAFDPLNEPFDPLTATEPPVFHSATCKGSTPKQSKPYNYEEPRQVFPDEKPEFIARKNEQIKKEGTIGGIQTSEFRQLIDDVAYMKGLLEAVIKAFDSALKTKSSNTGSLLFTKASSMPRKKDEETKTLEEDTEKIQEEQLEGKEDPEQGEDEIAAREDYQEPEPEANN